MTHASERGGKVLFLKGRSRVLTKVLLLVILLASAALRFAGFGDESLNGDELFSLRVASLEYPESIEAIARDVVHPPLYYLTLGAWVRVVGDDALSLRMLSLIFSILIIFLVFSITQHVTGSPWVGLLAMGLAGVSQLHAHYSLFVRSYAMYSALGLLVLLALVRAKQRPENLTPWVVLAVATSAFVLTHYVAWLYVLAAFPVVLATRHRQFIWRSVLVVLVAAVMFALWLSQMLPYLIQRQGLEANLGWVGQPSFFELAYVYASFVGLMDVDHASSLALVAGGLILLFPAITVIRRFLMTMGRDSDRTMDDRLLGALVLFSFALLPPLLLWLLSLPPVSLPIWGVRHVFPSQPAWVVLLAMGVSVIWSYRRLPGIGAVILVVAFQAAWIFQSCLICPHRTPYEKLADFLESSNYPNRLPVLTTWLYGTGLPLRYYMNDAADIRIAPDDAGQYPDNFWLVYRPDDAKEKSTFEALVMSRNWKVKESGYFSTGPQNSEPWGVKVMLFEKPAAR